MKAATIANMAKSDAKVELNGVALPLENFVLAPPAPPLRQKREKFAKRTEGEGRRVAAELEGPDARKWLEHPSNRTHVKLVRLQMPSGTIIEKAGGELLVTALMNGAELAE